MPACLIRSKVVHVRVVLLAVVRCFRDSIICRGISLHSDSRDTHRAGLALSLPLPIGTSTSLLLKARNSPVLLLKLSLVVKELVFELIDLLLLNLRVVHQAIIGLVVPRHLLLQLVCRASDLLNLHLQLRIDSLCLFHLPTEMVLILLHGLLHAAELFKARLKLLMKYLDFLLGLIQLAKQVLVGPFLLL